MKHRFVGSTWLFLLLIAVQDVSFVSGVFPPTGVSMQPEEYFSWKNLEWNFEDQRVKETVLKTVSYKHDRSVPAGFARWRDKIFVTIPRKLPGVLATLNYFRINESQEVSPKLTAYPSWSYNLPGSCNDTIVSAYKIEVDECDRLWIIDTGTMAIDFKQKLTCPPKVVVFDLLTDEIIRLHDLSVTFMPTGTFVANFAVESDSKSREDTFAYGMSTKADGLIVYHWRADKSWFVRMKKFKDLPPRKTEFYTYPLMLSGAAGYQKLHFHPFNRFSEYSILTRKLKSTANNDVLESMTFVRHSSSYSPAAVITHGSTFYTDAFDNSICCWRPTHGSRGDISVIAKNDTALKFPSDIKVINDTMWILSNRLADFLGHGLDYDEVNFRLLKLSMGKIAQSGICGLLEINSDSMSYL